MFYSRGKILSIGTTHALTIRCIESTGRLPNWPGSRKVERLAFIMTLLTVTINFLLGHLVSSVYPVLEEWNTEWQFQFTWHCRYLVPIYLIMSSAHLVSRRCPCQSWWLSAEKMLQEVPQRCCNSPLKKKDLQVEKAGGSRSTRKSASLGILQQGL